jgi:hypothetical protein
MPEAGTSMPMGLKTRSRHPLDSVHGVNMARPDAVLRGLDIFIIVRRGLPRLAPTFDEADRSRARKLYQWCRTGIKDGPLRSAGSTSKRTCTIGASVLLKTVWLMSPDSKKNSPGP